MTHEQLRKILSALDKASPNYECSGIYQAPDGLRADMVARNKRSRKRLTLYLIPLENGFRMNVPKKGWTDIQFE